MLTVPSSVNSTPTLSLPPAVLSVTATDAVSTRSTSVALPAPLSNQAAGDNSTQGSITIPATVVAEESAASAAYNANAFGTLTNTSTSGPSSSYLAQLFAQNTAQEDSDTEQAAVYSHFAPAAEYNTFVGYGFIKYKPSNAGIPPEPSPLPAPVIVPFSPPAGSVDEQATPATDNAQSQAATTTDSQSVSTQPVQATETDTGQTTETPSQEDTSAASAIPFTPVLPPTTGSTTSVAANNNIPQSPAPDQSTIGSYTFFSSNLQAYNQTLSRNQTNLSASPSQYAFAS